MAVGRDRIIPVDIEDELKTSYIDYAMSTIVSRALPDVRDGLKPSQRRVLLAMHDLKLNPGSQHRKCAKIAGDASGNYHPHGEGVVYPTLCRMAQDFSLRYQLVDGQGNFGSVDGDNPAAMRYTEARLTKPAVAMMEDLEKETVSFVPNYDETRTEPTVFPARFPNLLTNGVHGIAVGMATKIPPHNAGEVCAAIDALIDDPDLNDEDLLQLVTGPDFPTGGIIYGREGIREAYLTGRGSVILRARASIETDGKDGRETIIITEIPYELKKSELIEKIAHCVRAGTITGIRDLRDESDRDGMRIVIVLKKDANAHVVMNQLFKHTRLQDTFGANMIALVNGRPQVLTLRKMLTHFIEHRVVIVQKRSEFELRKAEERAHILEGLKVALDHIDAVIKTIRASKTPDEAKQALSTKFKLSDVQAQAIVDMRLGRLTGLERDKIETEYVELLQLIERLNTILSSRTNILQVVKTETSEVRKAFGDERRTEIIDAEGEFRIEDLIAEEDMVLTISHHGYVKRLPTGTYRRQGRGGRGITGAKTRDEDFIEHLFVASTHQYILFLTDRGRCHWLKVHQIPEGGRSARGKAIINMLPLEKGEAVRAFVPVKEFTEDHFLVMATRNGTIKKTFLTEFSRPRKAGIIAIGLDEGDTLIGASITDGNHDILLAKSGGKAIRFVEKDVRAMGRTARGVRGVELEGGEHVVGMVCIRDEVSSILVVTENGFGKRTALSDYRITRRGGKGIFTIKASTRNGAMVGIKEVVSGDEIMIITKVGVVIRLSIDNISEIGRNTQGVRLMKPGPEDLVVSVARAVSENSNEDTQA
ncbi:MAG: DNA gyrase subunit A [Gemmatimonadota bacterium]|nr:DNA gyrase subunit A [Gemmatimonadota bacterium]MDP6802605.1 DNA gyrase subunit A [Gemmatimonadota bacterium]MDP7030730.1 DNA gyrase subunit A [Gemmatimonadota bacterium]